VPTSAGQALHPVNFGCALPTRSFVALQSLQVGDLDRVLPPAMIKFSA